VIYVPGAIPIVAVIFPVEVVNVAGVVVPKLYNVTPEFAVTVLIVYDVCVSPPNAN
jgi:hypothetical protein